MTRLSPGAKALVEKAGFGSKRDLELEARVWERLTGTPLPRSIVVDGARRRRAPWALALGIAVAVVGAQLVSSAEPSAGDSDVRKMSSYAQWLDRDACATLIAAHATGWNVRNRAE